MWSIKVAVLSVSLVGMVMCGIILGDKIAFIKFCVGSWLRCKGFILRSPVIKHNLPSLATV